jgi:hypothetical protein
MNIQEWSSMLSQITPNGVDAHPILCETWGWGQGNRRYEVLSQEQYDNYFQTRSRWGNSCKKLTLAQMVTVSNQVIENMTLRHSVSFSNPRLTVKFGLEYDLVHSIDEVITYSNATDANRNAQITSKFNDVFDIINAIQTTTSSPTTMCERSTQKHTAEKVNSIWGEIKWYIWSWFYNARTNAEKFTNKMPREKQIFEDIFEKIIERLEINISGFEESEEIAEKTIQLSTRKDIKKWFAKYHPDKYKLKSKGSEDSRAIIFALMETWKAVCEIEKARKAAQPVPNLIIDLKLIEAKVS